MIVCNVFDEDFKSVVCANNCNFHLVNASGIAKEKIDSSPAISTAVAKFEAELGDTGRILLRASGTEPLVRVMVEAQSDSIAKEIAEKLAKVVEEELR